MGNTEQNFQAIKGGWRYILQHFGFVVDAPSTAAENGIDRLWIPTGSISSSGGSSGVANPTGLGCYRQLPRDPGAAIRVECPRSYTLTLDPEWTTPQAFIGISFRGPMSGQRTAGVILTPGDTLEIPQGFERFWVWAADNLDLQTNIPNLNLLGYVSFLIGRTLGAKPILKAPNPAARILAAARLTTNEVDQLGWIPSPKVPTVSALVLGIAAGEAATGNYQVVELNHYVWDRTPVTAAQLAALINDTPDTNPAWTASRVVEQLACPSQTPRFNQSAIGDAIFVTQPGFANVVTMSLLNTTQSAQPAAFTYVLLFASDRKNVKTFQQTIFDATSGANLALDSLTIPVTGFEALMIEEIPSGVAAAGVLTAQVVEPGGLAQTIFAPATPATAAPNFIFWGRGVESAAVVGNILGNIPGALPTRIRILLTALGAGIQGRVRVEGIPLTRGL